MTNQRSVVEGDTLIPSRLVERIVRQIPQAQFVIMPGTGHSPYFEKPEEWNRVVLEFLEGCALEPV